MWRGDDMPKSTFTRPLYTADVSRLEQGRPIRVILEDFEFHIGDENSPNVVEIPKGYCSDGASVPWFLGWYLEPWGRFAQAAIVHDYLYSTNRRARKESDEIFREAIVVITTDTQDDDPTMYGKCVAAVAYQALRVFGSQGYRTGRTRYGDRARRAKEKVFKRDRPLHDIIIEDPADL